jgi:carbamoyl-phosphate synthase small subunit
MKYSNNKEAVLLLEDGTTFRGRSIGKEGTKGGEICFNTGMTGYQEVYTDPSYFGQIIVSTSAHIGNYGINYNEQESASAKIAGLVVNKFSKDYSRHTADKSLQEYLEESQIVGISDIDTRKLVRHIRNKGAMNAIISSEELDTVVLRWELEKVPDMSGLELSTKVTVAQSYLLGKENNAKFKVAVLDLGIKQHILKSFVERGCICKVYPAKTSLVEMQKWNPDGYFISNGPGDPAAMDYATTTVKDILEKGKPLFGICLGHQLLAQACDMSTYKMHLGHRGLNHPVKNLLTGKSEITTQNHGFAVEAENIKNSKDLEITHINLNDGTIEGIKLKNKPAFSVQYHPESTPGPHDSRYLFDNFIDLMSNF